MKLVHLSDTHIGLAGCSGRFARVVDHIVQLPLAERQLIVHTGDLVDRSAAAEMQAGLALLGRLAAAGSHVFLCPGNHDYGDARRVIRTRAKVFRETFSNYLFGDALAVFPALRRIGDWVFVGLDSSAAELGFIQGLFAEGQIGREQLARLNGLLDGLAAESPRPRIAVYLHHHPFINGYAVQPDTGDGPLFGHLLASMTRPFRRLKDAYSLLQCLRDRVDLVLFGHQHSGLDHRAEAGRYGIPLAFDASSTTGANMATDRMRYRIIDLDAMAAETRMIPL